MFTAYVVQAVHCTKLNKAIAIIGVLSINMRTKHMFEARSLSTNLGTHVTNENDYIML